MYKNGIQQYKEVFSEEEEVEEKTKKNRLIYIKNHKI